MKHGVLDPPDPLFFIAARPPVERRHHVALLAASPVGSPDDGARRWIGLVEPLLAGAASGLCEILHPVEIRLEGLAYIPVVCGEYNYGLLVIHGGSEIAHGRKAREQVALKLGEESRVLKTSLDENPVRRMQRISVAWQLFDLHAIEPILALQETDAVFFNRFIPIACRRRFRHET